MDGSRITLGVSALCVSVINYRLCKKALRTGEVRIGDLTLGSPLRRSERPGSFWTGIIFCISMALIFFVAGVLAIWIGFARD
jgi:hypothetical protein